MPSLARQPQSSLTLSLAQVSSAAAGPSHHTPGHLLHALLHGRPRPRATLSPPAEPPSDLGCGCRCGCGVPSAWDVPSMPSLDPPPPTGPPLPAGFPISRALASGHPRPPRVLWRAECTRFCIPRTQLLNSSPWLGCSHPANGRPSHWLLRTNPRRHARSALLLLTLHLSAEPVALPSQPFPTRAVRVVSSSSACVLGVSPFVPSTPSSAKQPDPAFSHLGQLLWLLCSDPFLH